MTSNPSGDFMLDLHFSNPGVLLYCNIVLNMVGLFSFSEGRKKREKIFGNRCRNVVHQHSFFSIEWAKDRKNIQPGIEW